MKKIILFVGAALFLILGNYSVDAQVQMKKQNQSLSVDSTEAIAMKKTNQLVRPLGLNKKQQEQIYNLFLKTETKISKSEFSKSENKKDVIQRKGALNSELNKYVLSAMEDILTEKQFRKYSELIKKL